MSFKTWLIQGIICSAALAVLKMELVPMQFIYEKQFNGVHLMFAYVSFSSWETWDAHRKLQQAEPNSLVIHKNTGIYQLLQFIMYYEPHPYTSAITTFSPISDNPTSTNS